MRCSAFYVMFTFISWGLCSVDATQRARSKLIKDGSELISECLCVYLVALYEVNELRDKDVNNAPSIFIGIIPINILTLRTLVGIIPIH
ncbi:hypothetical protein XBFFR1_2040007 [Xenorhabdus bovienii str. feltiae France]|nr:hypothetical protein XBFFR1_2040007 [Xenorhabdus bovienii str. feltiae France]